MHAQPFVVSPFHSLHNSCCVILVAQQLLCDIIYQTRVSTVHPTYSLHLPNKQTHFLAVVGTNAKSPWLLIVCLLTWLWEGCFAISKIRPVRGKYGQPVTCDILWHFCCPCQVLYLFFVKVLGKYTNRMFMMNDFHPSFSAQYIYFPCGFANWSSVACVTCIIQSLDESIPYPLFAEIENRFHVFFATRDL